MINPKKLLNSKWTAVKPVNKEKHFLVTQLVIPESKEQAVEWIEIEAIHSQRKQLIQWRALSEHGVWLQGWR
jgi:tryptophan-rich hypothetical protein